MSLLAMIHHRPNALPAGVLDCIRALNGPTQAGPAVPASDADIDEIDRRIAARRAAKKAANG